MSIQLKSLTLCASILVSTSVFAESHSISRSPDMGVVNHDRILYWLEQRGELSPSATEDEKKKAIKQFIASKGATKTLLQGKLADSLIQSHKSTLTKMNQIKIDDKNSPLRVRILNPSSSKVTNTVKVLAIMVDFPDLKHDGHGLKPADTDMYYESYPESHYNDLLFSAVGYDGPDNQNIMSAYQYYQQESGESFSFTGNTFGWVTADNNASYYGANNNEGNDDKVGELIIEAVTKAVSDHQLNLDDYDKSDFLDTDGDGNINEPDGIVDHVMVFHSSIGEEAGGGLLSSEAVWSHRFFVFDESNRAISIPGSSTKIYGYTINPIDSGTGVVVHEFGHDLGVPDEYDTKNIDIGAPVAAWSVMASGSWLGDPRGTRPNSFSPYAREYFQTRYDGNWINQEVVMFDGQLETTYDLKAATNHDSGINQLKINLPKTPKNFGAPFSGSYQYYSNRGDQLQNKLSFTANLQGNTSTLKMKARWDIEKDYDYVLVKVNNVPVVGNHTSATNEFYSSVNHFISGQSSDISSASTLGWVDLTFDLSSYANQNVTITIEYITDEAVGGYGFVLDDMSITSNQSTVFEDGAENVATVSMDGFARIDNTIEGDKQYYYVQLRDHSGTDASLSTLDYDPGVLVWYRNEGIDDNNVSQHAGEVFLGVVDADQNLIKRNNKILNTEFQLRDAAFSLYNQTSSSNDAHLSNKSVFKDSDDYSAPNQPESGIVLPKLGVNLEVITQSSDSATASITLSKNNLKEVNVEQTGLTVSLSVSDANLTTSSTFNWNMGDGSQLTGNSINHTYLTAGTFNVEVTYSTSVGNQTVAKEVIVGTPITGSISLSNTSAVLNFEANLNGGEGDYTYRWNFGDNEGTSSLSNGQYTYKNDGNFVVTLNVTDDTRQSFIFTENVSILNPLATSFSSTKDNLALTLSSDTSGGSKPYTYLWNFGDSNTSTEANPTHTYTTANTYTVELTVTDSDDKVVSSTSNITVSAAATTTPPTTPSNPTPTSQNSGGSGGSITWFTLCLFGITLLRKKNVSL